MKPTLLLGAPGTGKTYQLVQKILEVRPDKFALVSFTRRAANEAKQRLRAYYSEKELKYVRTIHSLCFELLGLRTTQVMTIKYLMQFGNEYGYEFTFKSMSQEDGTYYGLTEDDIEYRNMMIQIAKSEEYKYWPGIMWKHYNEFKTNNFLYDYHDMLVFGRATYKPFFDLLCVDEIQDLTPLQLSFIDSLNSKQIIFAGDDNQMIFEWAGVDRNEFIQLKNNSDVEILNKNYRLPSDINDLAYQVIIPNGHHKFYTANIQHLSYFPEINKNESYLILARNGYILRRWLQEYDVIGFIWEWLHLDNRTSNKNKYNVLASTIHGAKGAEADNVILLTDVSPATYEQIDSEMEKRVWYVGITRARKKLYIIEPQTAYFYDLS